MPPASDAEARGVLRIDLPIVFGRKVVLPILADLVRRHPALQLDVRLSDAYADIIRDGVDIAVRVGDLDDSTLVARRFASQDMVLCAAPAYLAARGTPRRVPDLEGHSPVLFRMPTTGRDRPWQLTVDGKPVLLHPAARIRFNDGEAMLEALRQGLGIAQLPDYIVADDIARGALVELLPRSRPPTLPIHAVIPANRMVPARVRAVLDALYALPGAVGRRPAPRGRSSSANSRAA